MKKNKWLSIWLLATGFGVMWLHFVGGLELDEKNGTIMHNIFIGIGRMAVPSFTILLGTAFAKHYKSKDVALLKVKQGLKMLGISASLLMVYSLISNYVLGSNIINNWYEMFKFINPYYWDWWLAFYTIAAVIMLFWGKKVWKHRNLILVISASWSFIFTMWWLFAGTSSPGFGYVAVWLSLLIGLTWNENKRLFMAFGGFLSLHWVLLMLTGPEIYTVRFLLESNLIFATGTAALILGFFKKFNPSIPLPFKIRTFSLIIYIIHIPWWRVYVLPMKEQGRYTEGMFYRDIIVFGVLTGVVSITMDKWLEKKKRDIRRKERTGK